METQTNNRPTPWGNTAVAPKIANPAINDAVRARLTPARAKTDAQEDTRFKEISANPFHKIVFNESIDEEERANQVALTLKEASVKDVLLFDEWLASMREKMASELIALNDSDTRGELVDTINMMGTDLINFEEQSKPFNALLESSYTLRTNGVVLDAVHEAKEYKTHKAELDHQLEETDKKLENVEIETNRLLNENIQLSNDKNIFGKQKSASKTKQSQNELRLEEIKSSLVTLTDEKKSIEDKYALLDNKDDKFAKEKAILREALNVSSAEHKKMAEEYKATAQRFIEVSKTRVGSLRASIDRREDQINRFKKSNKNLLMVYAILDQGVGRAFENVQNDSAALDVAPEKETLLMKSKREQNKESVDAFAKTLETIKNNTLNSFASITRQGVTVTSMKDANDKAIATVRNIHTQGIAEVAENMSVMLEGIAGAALGEASAVAQQALDRMNRTTSDFAQQEVIKQAMSVNDEIGQISRNVDNLAQMGDTLTKARSIHRDSLATLRGIADELREKARSVIEATQDATAVNAELRDDKPVVTESTKTETNPLGI